MTESMRPRPAERATTRVRQVRHIRCAAMRVLVVTNLWPTAERPAVGGFVRDQVEDLRGIDGVEVEVFHIEPGALRPYPRAARELRRRYRGERFDVVHAHYGL